jgi:DNA polymerase-1
LRIMAHISADAGLLEAFERGEDIHRATAAQVFGRSLSEVTPAERSYVKAINFGLIYGMSAFGLARQLGLERATAQGFIDSYFARYPGVLKYMEATRVEARERGYVETVFGRRLWLPEIRSTNQARRAGAERAAINAPMQGTAADLIKLAMIEVQRWIDREGLATKLVMQVHDELVFEAPEAELPRLREALPQLMSGVASLRVPLAVEVGVGPNWEAAH